MRKETKYILFILIIASILRFWQFWDMPLMHDELSTLARAQYGSFSELIEKGVKGDYHPAGLQIFLWLWVKIAGISAFAVKLPFLLCGIGSVYMSYKIAKKCFGETTALLVAAYMATLQYTIVYGSLIARMYPLGLFFSLLMVYAWLKMVEDKNFSWQNSLIFVIPAIFCTHLHHFSMLFIAIVGFSGLFLQKKEAIWRYTSLLFLIFIAYLPNIPLLLAQIKEGGAEWMGSISPDFFRYYFGYLCHFSFWLVAAVGILILIQISQKVVEPSRNAVCETHNKKYQLLFLIWFLAPILSGYVYSILRAPVLQNYVLIFSFPYLLFFIFSFFKNWGNKKILFALLLIFVVNIGTLLFERAHFKTFYHQPFEKVYEAAFSAKQKYGSQVRSIYNLNPKYFAYYDSVKPTNAIFLPNYAENIEKWQEKIKIDTAQYLLLGEVSLIYYLTAKQYFPYEIERQYGFTHEIHLLSKKNNSVDKSPTILVEGLAEDSLFLPENISYNAIIQADIFMSAEGMGQAAEEAIFQIVQKGKVLWEQKQILKDSPENAGSHYFFAERLRHVFTYTQSRKDLCVVLKTRFPAKIQVVAGNPYIYGISHEMAQ